MTDAAWAFATVVAMQATSAFISWNNGRNAKLQSEAILGKTSEVHALVNSQYSQAKREIAEGDVTIAVLLQKIATLTGTTEDSIRAEIAVEQAKRSTKLPREAM